MNSEDNALFQWLQVNNKLDDVWLTQDHVIHLLKYCIIWSSPALTSPAKIASALGLSGKDLTRFIKDMNDVNSPIRQIVDLARLQFTAEMKFNAAERAKESATGLKAFQQMQKDEELKELREALMPSINPEEKDLFRGDAKQELSYFTELQDFMMNASPSEIIPVVLQEYWNKLNIVNDLLASFEFRAKGRKYIMNIIRHKFGCSEQYAYRIINETISFFNINEEKSSVIRRLIDDLEKIKAVAWHQGDSPSFINALKEQVRLAEMIKDSSELPPEIYEGRLIITSHNPEEFGIKPADRNALKARIKRWKLSSDEKQKLLNEIDVYDNEQENISQEDLSE